jgi:hypothetical protein
MTGLMGTIVFFQQKKILNTKMQVSDKTSFTIYRFNGNAVHSSPKPGLGTLIL